MHRFQTKQDASAAGYWPVRGPHFSIYTPGGRIECWDVSGHNRFGYDFQIVAVPDYSHAERRPGRPDPLALGQTVTVWFEQERNQAHQLGAFEPMFTPETIARDIPAAKAFLARWYRESGDEAADQLAEARAVLL